MRPIVRPGLSALVAGLVLTSSPLPALAQGPGQPAAGTGKAAAGGGAAAPAARPSPADLAKRNEVLATANADKVTRGDLVSFLSQYDLAPGMEQTAYTTGLDILINTKLLTQFLNENRIQVKDEEVNKILEQRRKMFSEGGSSLEKVLAESGLTLDQVKAEIRSTLQWGAYIEKATSNQALEAYMKANPDFFNGTLVRISHIQANVEPGASASDKQKAREKLLAIKKEIQSGKISFADAANKYSEDPTNKEQPSGGDLKWANRMRNLDDAIMASAFSLKKGDISDPVESSYGYHLIYVADRREGKMPALEAIREKVKNQFAVDEQNRIVADMRKKAKIDIKPMPADLFGPRPAAGSNAAPKAASGTTKS